MSDFTFKKFKKELPLRRKKYRKFLKKTEEAPPKNIDKMTVAVEPLVWEKIDCLSCANCCKTMTPTFTMTDIRRISQHLNMKPAAFKKKWLKKDDSKDWVNVTQPCQFLDMKTNMCGIYEVRPVDCSGFPHLSKRKWESYAHVHKQNIDYCPATFTMVEKVMALVREK